MRGLCLGALVVGLFLVPPAATVAKPRLAGHFQAVIAETDAGLHQVKLFQDGGLYASGADGHFLASPDSGKTWEATQVKEGVLLRTMSWPSRRTVLLAGREDGRNVVFRSTDGGATFERKSVDTDLPIRGWAFFGRYRGFLVAGSSKSLDGTWRVTKDGGVSFQKIESVAYANPARTLLSISRAGEKGLVAVGSHVENGYVGEAAKSLLYRKKHGAVLRSTDEGESWEVLDAGNAAGTLLWGVDFLDDRVGCVVGDAGYMARTADGGKTWQKLTTGTKARLTAVDVIDEGTAYAVGEKGTAIGTNDSGATVVTFATGTKADLRDLSFLDERTGFAVGASGTVLRFVRDY